MPDLPHLASRLFGTPLLVARPKLDVILGVLGPRLAGQAAMPFDATDPTRETTIATDGIVIVPVTGTLVSRSGYLSAASGLTAYADIGASIEAAFADPSVRGVILDVDSPGGEVGGLFDLADRIGALRAAGDKPVWAIANEAALSAAYAIASSAACVYVTQTGEVGSIGVVAVHVDESGADSQAGHTWSFIHAGERKVDGNPHEPLSSRARADIQADVNRLYERFVTLVGRNRRLVPDAVRATEAAVFRGQIAVSVGLADRVGTLDQAIAHMAAVLAPKSLPRGPAAHSIRPSKEASLDTVEPAAIAAAPETAPATPAATTPAADASAQIEQRLRAEFSELAAIAAQAARLGVTIDAGDAMAKGVHADALRRSVLEQLAARADAADVVAAIPPAGSKPAGESPIVKRAREAAERSR